MNMRAEVMMKYFLYDAIEGVEEIAMKKRVTFAIDEKDAEGVKKLAEKLDVSQVEIFRTGLKRVLKLKVTEQKTLFKKK